MRLGIFLIAVALLGGCTAAPPREALPDLERQVAETEYAFARTMANRDFAAFTSFLSDEAVFIAGSASLRGKQAVADRWKRYYGEPEAPFSWEPERVEVLDSGTLALSTGPVRDAGGKPIGTFASIWRQEAPGTWRIVFDKGGEACACEKQ